ncbi:MAG TPA: sulfatase-like hydrolase/transferase, partial [Ktedonobacteraceae bacterium]
MNVLFIMSDEHRRDAMGCSGHPLVRTPNLDALAEQGTRFTNAYCNSPLCIPSRASFATGLHVHEIAYWDNDKPYSGTPDSWGSYLDEHGVKVVTVGKLHFDPAQSNGFTDQRCPRKVSNDPAGLFRNPVRQRKQARQRFTEVGAGDFWTHNTEQETQTAIDFLSQEAGSGEKPWVLWLSYLPPHFPLIAPQRFYDLYPEEAVDLPYDYPSADHHPALEELREHFAGRNLDEATLRRTRAAYYGMVSFIDEQIGRVLRVLKESGHAEDTLIIYTSDHGEMLGDHELWWKSAMYEQSAAIPLIMAGPSIARGAVRNDPTSLIDLTSTIADAVGLEPHQNWRGRSLLPVAEGREHRAETEIIFSQYHGHGVSHGIFMIRKGRFKYIYYPFFPAQLFDMENDPREMHNLATDANYAAVLAELHR